MFIPLTVGGGVNSVDDIRALLNAGADKVSINTAGVRQSRRCSTRRPRATARSASSPRSTPRQSAPGAWQRLHARRPHADRASMRSTWAREVAARGAGRDPADQHGSRRRAYRLRPRADARASSRPSTFRSSRPAASARSRIWSTAIVVGGADAVLAASIFHYGEFTIGAGESGDGRGRYRGAHARLRRCALDTPRNGRTLGPSMARNPHPDMDWLDQVKWAGRRPRRGDRAGRASGNVLTLAWMNREALARTAATGEAHYWSRSRRRLWRKGESSGHVQKVREVRLDCDSDAILLDGRTDRRHRLSHRARALLFPAPGRRPLGGRRAGGEGPAGDLRP